MLSDGLENFHLNCLMCWEREEIILPEYPGCSPVAAFHEHALELHLVPQAHLEAATRREYNAHRYTLPDGRPLLLAVER